MGQGFKIEINNATPHKLAIQSESHNNIAGAIPLTTSVEAGGSTGQLYYEVDGGAVGTIFFNYQVDGEEVDPGHAEIRLDSASTSEFKGSIYVASYVLTPVISTGDQLFPVLLVNQVIDGSNAWPLGVLAIVEAVTSPSQTSGRADGQ